MIFSHTMCFFKSFWKNSKKTTLKSPSFMTLLHWMTKVAIVSVTNSFTGLMTRMSALYLSPHLDKLSPYFWQCQLPMVTQGWSHSGACSWCKLLRQIQELHGNEFLSSQAGHMDQSLENGNENYRNEVLIIDETCWKVMPLGVILSQPPELRIILQQECIPVGCILPAHWLYATHAPCHAHPTCHACPLQCLPLPMPPWHAYPPCHACPLLWTEFLTHVSENVTLPQLRCGR